MILQGMREKEIFTSETPFRIVINEEDSFDYPLHWHNAVEIVYVEKGNGTVDVGNKSFTLSEKDIAIIAAGDIHTFHANNSKGKRYFIQFDCTNFWGFNDNKLYRAYQNCTDIICSKENAVLHAELENHINKIINEYNNMGFAYDLFFYARLLDISVILSRNVYKNYNDGGNYNNTYALTKLNRVFEYIEENYNRPISLYDVSKAAGFSEYHFSRFFKKVTEKNFHTYLNEFRVKKAEKFLFDNTTITEAAYAAGFSSIVTFNRIFKQIKGCSPREYMKKRV